MSSRAQPKNKINKYNHTKINCRKELHNIYVEIEDIIYCHLECV